MPVAGRHGDVRQDREELGVVPGLTGGQPDRQRPTAAIDRRVGLGGPPATGMPQGVVGGLRR